MSEIVVLGWIDFEPGHRERWMAHIDELVESSRREPGVRRYVVLPDPNSSTGVFTQEHYASAAALDDHRFSEHHERFKAQTEGCKVRDRDIAVFDATKR